MPDPTPAPTPTPTPGKPARSRSALNQDWIQALNDAGQIVATAQKAEYAPTFASGGIDAAKLTALDADIAAAQRLAGTATQQTTGKEGVTKTEGELKEQLVGLLQVVQSRAKQKHAAANPTVLQDYAVGEKFYSSRALLEQTATNLLSKLATDPLPGIDAAKISEITQALDDYQKVQTAQSGGQSGATTARADLEAAVKDIMARRREIQFAADAQWPASNPANAGIRREFKLPPDKAFK